MDAEGLAGPLRAARRLPGKSGGKDLRREMNERTVAITRLFDAPRERVFAAWTQPEHLARWFGPMRFTVPSCEIDPRPGGVFRVCVRSPKGHDFWVRGVFRELA